VEGADIKRGLRREKRKVDSTKECGAGKEKSADLVAPTLLGTSKMIRRFFSSLVREKKEKKKYSVKRGGGKSMQLRKN